MSLSGTKEIDQQKTVVAFGEILWDLLPSGPQLGGAPFNFAYRVSSLGHRAIIVSRLGNDDLGKKACRQAESLGMDTRYIQWDGKYPTGTVQITLDEKNNPDFYIVPDVAYDNIETTEELLVLGAGADCVCFGTLIQRTATARHTLARLLDSSGDALKLLDINLRKNCYSTETITWSLENANILKLNEDEGIHLADLFHLSRSTIPSFCEEIIHRFSLDHCLVTLGEYGVFAASWSGEKVYVPGCQVSVVDTCGSGDAFAAGFIHGLLRDKSLKECCNLGNAMGAMVAAQPGATIPISKDEINEFMWQTHPRLADSRLESFIAE